MSGGGTIKPQRCNTADLRSRAICSAFLRFDRLQSIMLFSSSRAPATKSTRRRCPLSKPTEIDSRIVAHNEDTTDLAIRRPVPCPLIPRRLSSTHNSTRGRSRRVRRYVISRYYRFISIRHHLLHVDPAVKRDSMISIWQREQEAVRQEVVRTHCLPGKTSNSCEDT